MPTVLTARKKKTGVKAKGKYAGTHKMDAIRVVVEETEYGSPNEVAAKLKKEGVKVSAGYVSTIKAADKRKALLCPPTRILARSDDARPSGQLEVVSKALFHACHLLVALDGDIEELTTRYYFQLATTVG